MKGDYISLEIETSLDDMFDNMLKHELYEIFLKHLNGVKPTYSKYDHYLKLYMKAVEVYKTDPRETGDSVF